MTASGLGCVKTFWMWRAPARPISITPQHAQFDDLCCCEPGINPAVCCVIVNLVDTVRQFQPLCPDRCQERLYAHDIHDACEIIGEDVQRHFAGDVGQTFHQEVRRAPYEL